MCFKDKLIWGRVIPCLLCRWFRYFNVGHFENYKQNVLYSFIFTVPWNKILQNHLFVRQIYLAILFTENKL